MIVVAEVPARPPLSEGSRRFLRYAADVAIENRARFAEPERLLHAGIVAALAVRRLGCLPVGDDEEIAAALDRAFTGRALTVADVGPMLADLAR